MRRQPFPNMVFDVIDMTTGETVATYPTQLRARNHCDRLEPLEKGYTLPSGWRYVTRPRHAPQQS